MNMEQYRRSFIVVACAILGAYLPHSAVAQSKLYINKAADPANVVILEGELSASVTHTAEGLELEIPGVAITLDCANTAGEPADPAETCTVAIGTGFGGGDTGGGDTGGGDTGGGDTGGGDTGGGDTGGGDTGGGDTGGGTSGACGSKYSNDYVIDCKGDIGPGNWGDGTKSTFAVDRRELAAYKFTIPNGASAGRISASSSGAYAKPANGATTRFFWSETPGSRSFSKNNDGCRTDGAYPAMSWGYGSNSCPLKPGNTYYLNMVACTVSKYCSGTKYEPADRNVWIVFQQFYD